MQNNAYRITMLEAAEGDCLFLEFWYGSEECNILIDAGPSKCWRKSLKPLLDKLISEGRRIDILLITHIDSDHIGGAIKLFQEGQYNNLVGEVWFNGLQQIACLDRKHETDQSIDTYQRIIGRHWWDYSDESGPISAQQALSLANLLTKYNQNWNRTLKGKAITCNTQSVVLSPNFEIEFLLPQESRLAVLLKKFRFAIEPADNEKEIALTPSGEAAFEYLMLDENACDYQYEPISKTYDSITEIEKWAAAASIRDVSYTNASSVAICIHFYGKRMLFLGDAIAEDILTVLEEKHGQETNYEVIKLPHHGCYKNCLDLLDKIDAKYFLISTDGARFDHPSKETLAKIVTRPSKDQRFVLFNYRNEMFKLFENESMEERYHYRALVQPVFYSKVGDCVE